MAHPAGAGGTPMYYDDGLIPIHQQGHAFSMDDDPRVATYEGHKVVVVLEPTEKEAAGPPLPPDPVHATVPPLTATICGFRRRTFYIILVAAALLIGIVAGLAGGLTSRQRSSSNAEDVGAPAPSSADSGLSSSTTPTRSSTPTASSAPRVSLVHGKSQLAAARSANSTESSSYVAYQDPAGALMLAAWSSRDTTWRSVNISDRMLKAAFPVRPKLGTPLACITGIYTEVHVLFLDEDNVLREVYTKDDGRYESWSRSSLYEDTRILATKQSGLAAHWIDCAPRCPKSEDGQGQVRLFFEAEPGDFVTYLGAPWRHPTNFSATGREGSGLATTPYVRSDARHMMFFFDTGEKLGMMTRRENDTDWALDEAFTGITHPTLPGQRIAAAAFEVDPLDEADVKDWAILAVQVEKDGKLAATYWDPRVNSKGTTADKWTFGRPVELVGGPQPPPAFTAIAVTIVDGLFYGIADGTILQYRIQRDNITRFVFAPGNVTSGQ